MSVVTWSWEEPRGGYIHDVWTLFEPEDDCLLTDPMKSHIQRIRNELLSTPDTVCLERARLVTEAFREHAGDPLPLKRANAFAHVLRNMTLDVTSNPFFAGNTSSHPRAWMLVPEHGLRFGDRNQMVVENPDLTNFLADKIPEDLRTFWDGRSVGGSCAVGHLAVDCGRVVRDGLQTIIDETEACCNGGDPEGDVFRQAMATSLRAVCDWAVRYAAAAGEAAERAGDPVIRAAHLRVADACLHVPARPARDVFEGLQAIVLIHLALHLEGHGVSVSVGLPDRALAHLIDDGVDQERTADLVSAFMLKLTANSVFGRVSKTQAITVGGLNHLGEDQCNLLTRCFLEAADCVRVGDPHVFLRWHERISDDVKTQASALLAAGLSMPLLVHDEPTAQGFLNAGCIPEDAWDYCVIGCNELGIPGRSMESSTSRHGMIQHLAILNETLLEHPDPESIGTMEELLACVEARTRRRLRLARERGENHRHAIAERAPMPFTSALMNGCIACGKDFNVGMPYLFPGLYERGLTNAANALAAIEQLVFKDGCLTLPGLLASMRSDFEDPAIREQLLSAPKWGNDDDRADVWAQALVSMRDRVLDDIDQEFSHPAHFVCHVVRSLHHTDGWGIAASPDGRLAGTPVCDSIGAQTGSAANGPTATLRSVLKLDAARFYRGGYNLNVALPGARTTPQTVRVLIDGFFGEGGQELQINCFDAATLREAGENPDKHGDLVVRFAGLSSRFVDLSPAEQEEVIARADAMV